MLSVFFQAVGFIPGIDTQPNFILLFLVFLPLMCNHLIISVRSLLVVCVLVCILLLAFFFHADNITLKTALTYLAPIAIAFAIFTLMSSGYFTLSSKFLIFVVIVYLLAGIGQFVKPDFLSFLVTRSVDAALSFSESGRGVRSLTGEPAHFGKILIIINVFFVLVYAVEKNFIFSRHDVNYIMWISFLLFVANLLVPRSFYSAFNHFLVWFFLTLFLKPRLAFGILLCLLFVGLYLGASIFIYESDVRLLNILKYMLYEPQRLLEFGAFRRVMNIPLTFYNLSYFGPFGAGDSGFSTYASFQTPLGELRYNVFGRLYGGVLEYLLKFGVFSLPVVGCVIYFMFSSFKFKVSINGRVKKLGLWLFCALFLVLFQDGAPAKPLPIFLLIFTFFMLSFRRSKGETV
ncbi:hypothetical protein [Vibrio sp. 16]|uniref:hypothetical protein n=1 Tax=Vibrio sp. 16 TaxID=391586 RepID=UPI00030AD8FF|nr:hypothetical protein [Vibrio sp. 16]CAK4070525.1 hypothetical protein VDT1_2507 [Vibrio sp. 16]